MDFGVRGGGGIASRGPGRVGARRGWRPRPISARDRPPRCSRLPARPHAAGLRAGDQARRRLHRAGPGGHEGRAPDRPPRAEHHHHDRRAKPSRVRQPRDDQGRRRGRRDRLVRLRLHTRRDQDSAGDPATGRAAAAVQRPLQDSHAHRGHRSREALVEEARPADRRLPGDQAPDLPRRPRASARAAAREGSAPRRLERSQGTGVHPVVRAVQPQAAQQADARAPRPARGRQRRRPGRDDHVRAAVRPPLRLDRLRQSRAPEPHLRLLHHRRRASRRSAGTPTASVPGSRTSSARGPSP